MASGFPGSIDSFTNPLTTSALNSPSHAGQHQDLNDAVNKIETYMGLVKVIPTVSSTGGTAATVSATGTINIGNGNTAITVTAFSSLYDNYRILITNGAASTNVQLRIQLVNNTSALYYGAYAGTNYSTSAFYGQNDNGATLFSWCGYGSTGGLHLDAEIQSPFLVARKYLQARNVYVFAGTAYGSYAAETTSTASASGFTLSPNTGSLTSGTIRVYGYRN